MWLSLSNQLLRHDSRHVFHVFVNLHAFLQGAEINNFCLVAFERTSFVQVVLDNTIEEKPDSLVRLVDLCCVVVCTHRLDSYFICFVFLIIVINVAVRA